MAIQGIYAVICVTDIERSIEWYAKLMGSAPRDRPMDFLAQWYGDDRNLQLWQEPTHAGHSLSTIVVTNVEDERSRLQALGLDLGEAFRGDFGAIAQIKDPGGNMLTLAEPPSPE